MITTLSFLLQMIMMPTNILGKTRTIILIFITPLSYLIQVTGVIANKRKLTYSRKEDQLSIEKTSTPLYLFNTYITLFNNFIYSINNSLIVSKLNLTLWFFLVSLRLVLYYSLNSYFALLVIYIPM